MIKAEFNEEDHPRDENGKFTESGGGGKDIVKTEAIFPVTDDIPDFRAYKEEIKMNAMVSQLVATQSTLNMNGVKEKISNKSKRGGIEVIADGNRYLILDGHHSAAAAKLSGDMFVLVHIIGTTQGVKS